MEKACLFHSFGVYFNEADDLVLLQYGWAEESTTYVVFMFLVAIMASSDQKRREDEPQAVSTRWTDLGFG